MNNNGLIINYIDIRKQYKYLFAEKDGVMNNYEKDLLVAIDLRNLIEDLESNHIVNTTDSKNVLHLINNQLNMLIRGLRASNDALNARKVAELEEQKELEEQNKIEPGEKALHDAINSIKGRRNTRNDDCDI